MQSQFNFTQQQLKQYAQCPDVNYMGGHLGGLSSCVYCAEIFRRYRIFNGQKVPTQNNNKNQNKRQEFNNVAGPEQDNDPQDCGKLVCMKAGFCTCG